ncbi:hypothetical protein [Flammeovirga pacifica]|uniref:Uncharacterized protein n=1 Tax=Flammeovirga pacifica TaxID=915059 RepID=A0A1S1YTP0_FLAPC|nr:hypothetical protein [Flammeovirga pacifica]OHX64397.1 hypothetical protein NH26_22655 [Flammeovirga pacifica]
MFKLIILVLSLKVIYGDVVVSDHVTITMTPSSERQNDPTSLSKSPDFLLRYYPNPAIDVVMIELK